MFKNSMKKLPLMLLAALVLTICFVTASMFLSDGTASALPGRETITIAHITDIHYFPLDYCYVYSKNGDGTVSYIDRTTELYKQTDFNMASYGDTKLIAESGVILAAISNNILSLAEEKASNLEVALASLDIDEIMKAEDDLDTIPDYMILTGDLSKNSERVGLIDVANTFRDLQNKLRAISYNDGGEEIFPFQNFQVFATPGNHDLYNNHAKLYDNDIRKDGAEYLTDTLDTSLYAMIFAGLGFPGINSDIYENVFRAQVAFSESEADKFDIGLSDESYWYGSFNGKYVFSSLAENLNMFYYDQSLRSIATAINEDYSVKDSSNCNALYDLYNNISDGYNALSYIAEVLNTTGSYSTGYTFAICDASDREISDDMVPVIANAKQILARQNLYTYDRETNSYSRIENIIKIREALTNGEKIYYNTGWKQITGGKVTEDLLDWIDETINGEGSLVGKSFMEGAEETIIAAAHHNFLPHFDMEDDLVKDFTLYNWEYVAKRLLKIGVRYTLSGHMHANDIATYVDAAGRVLYDFETGATVSFSAPTRMIEIERTFNDEKDGFIVKEDVNVSIKQLQSIKETQSSNISFTDSVWNDISVEGLTSDQEKFEARFAANPNFLIYSLMYDELKDKTFNEHIDSIIYLNLLERMLDNYLSLNMIDSLTGSLEGFFNGTFKTMLAGVFKDYADVTYKLVDSMIDQVLNDMTYVYNGGVFVKDPNNASEPPLVVMLRAIIDDFLDIEYGAEGRKMKLRDVVVEVLKGYTISNEFKNINEILNPELSEDANNQAIKKYNYALALRDLIKQSEDGTLVKLLADTLLNPLLKDDSSLIKVLLDYKFDFTSLNLTPTELDNINSLFDMAVDVLNSFIKDGPLLDSSIISIDNFCLGDILNSAKPVLNSVLNSMLGVDLGDMSISEFAEDFIDKYLTESFYTGTGGIVKNILIAFAVDTTKDVEDFDDPSAIYHLRFAKDYEFDPAYAVEGEEPNITPYTYIQAQRVSDDKNPATVENYRLPNRLTANFDTKNPTTEFALSYYTDEEIFTKFEILNSENQVVATVETAPNSAVTYNKQFTEPGKLGWATRSNSAANSNITVNLITTTMPSYIPLIDLGIMCLTHTEVTYEVGDNEYYYSSDMRNGDMERSELFISNYVRYMNRHTLKISGLDSGTTYRYRVYGTYEEKEFALHQAYGVEYFTMTTAMGADSDKFSFIAIADLQASILEDYKQSKKAMDVINQSEKTKDYNFILNAGDMTDYGKNFYQWGWALDTLAETFANTSMLFAAGNHENDSNFQRNFFNYTLSDDNSDQVLKNGMYYSLDYGTMHLVVLNTNEADNKGLSSAQLNWLKADLAANEKKWTVVLMHKSLYSAGSHSTDADIVAMRSQLNPIFVQYGVDLVLAGHDHTYTTTQIIDKTGNKVLPAKDRDGNIVNADIGVIYMTLGTMGEKFYNVTDNDEVNSRLDNTNSILDTLTKPTFAKISIDGDSLVVKGYEVIFGDQNIISEISSLKLSQKMGKVGDAASKATINGEAVAFGQKFSVGYFNLKNNFSIDLSEVKEGSSIVYYSNGKELDGLKLGLFDSSKIIEIMIKDADGNFYSLGTVELVRDGFALYTALFVVGLFLVLAGAAVAIMLVVKKSKKSSGDGGNEPDGDKSKSIDADKEEGNSELKTEKSDNTAPKAEDILPVAEITETVADIKKIEAVDIEKKDTVSNEKIVDEQTADIDEKVVKTPKAKTTAKTKTATTEKAIDNTTENVEKPVSIEKDAKPTAEKKTTEKAAKPAAEKTTKTASEKTAKAETSATEKATKPAATKQAAEKAAKAPTSKSTATKKAVEKPTDTKSE